MGMAAGGEILTAFLILGMDYKDLNLRTVLQSKTFIFPDLCKYYLISVSLPKSFFTILFLILRTKFCSVSLLLFGAISRNIEKEYFSRFCWYLKFLSSVTKKSNLFNSISFK